MKTGLLVSSISRRAGGVFHASRRLAQEMQFSGGIESDVLSLRDEYSDDFLKYWQPLDVHLFEVVGPRWFGYAPGFSECLRSQEVDLVHLHGIWMYPSIVAWRWAESSGRPLVISSHGMLDPWALRHSWAKKRIARILFEDRNLRSARCIRSLCPAETQAIRKLGFPNSICEIPNGVDVPERPRPDGRSRETGNVLLYIGRLHPKKQLPSLVRAWKRLEELSVPGFRDWHLSIAGWGDSTHLEELQALVDDLGVPRVRLYGPVFGGALTSLLFSADGLILPSISEGLPMVVLEAWAHELPVIMTERCNLPNGFAHGAAIRTAPDVEGLSRAIAELIRMSDRDRTEMGRQGLALVRQKYAWPEIAGRMTKVYEWLLGGGPIPETVI